MRHSSCRCWHLTSRAGVQTSPWEKGQARSGARALGRLSNLSFEVQTGEIFGLLGTERVGQDDHGGVHPGTPASGWWRDRSARTRPASGTRTGAADDRQPLAGRGAAGAEQGLGGAALCRSLSAGGALGATACRLGGLESRRNAAFADLSGGQQQLFVALALVSDPTLVILDEMTTGPDAAALRVAWDLVTAVRDRGATVLLVTHFMDEAEGLCDRGAVLSADRGAALETWAPRPRCPRW